MIWIFSQDFGQPNALGQIKPSLKWIVLGKPIYVSANEMQILRSLEHIHGPNFINNFRPLQPKNGRVVENNFELRPDQLD